MKDTQLHLEIYLPAAGANATVGILDIGVDNPNFSDQWREGRLRVAWPALPNFTSNADTITMTLQDSEGSSNPLSFANTVPLASTVGLTLLEQKPGSDTYGTLKYGRAGTGVGKPSEDQARLIPSCEAAAVLKERHIYCAVASHFSNHDLVFLQSMMQLILGATMRISFGWSCDPSVERARNILTANFLETNCTHLLFIDSDIAFLPRDVQRIISHDEDIVGGIYPLKTMDSEVKWCGNHLAVGPAAPAGANAGAAESSHRLDATTAGAVREDGLQEVGSIGTGFLCIARRALEKMIAQDGDAIVYQQDWAPFRREYAFWRQEVREVDGKRRFLTEDWNFCYRWRELGGSVFADTQVALRHAGRAVWPLDLQNGNPFARPITNQPIKNQRAN